MRFALRSSRTLPIELIREIIKLILYSESHVTTPQLTGPLDTRGVSSKPVWSLIQHFSVASKAYRALSLEAWFRKIIIRSPDDITYITKEWPEIGAHWTRELQIILGGLTSIWNISVFRFLQTLRLDFMRIPYTFAIMDSPRSLISVDINLGTSYPTPGLVKSIAAMFPYMEIFHMKAAGIWCDLCFLCLTPSFKSPGPTTIVYKNGFGLPMYYAKILSSHSQLHTVVLTVPYLANGITTLGSDIAGNPNLWAGECDACMELFYGDEAYRSRWVMRKQGIGISGEEDSGNISARYIKPPALKYVEWRFWKKPDRDEDIEDYLITSEDDLNPSEEDLTSSEDDLNPSEDLTSSEDDT